MRRCPELNACISAALWCDGEPHCPSGFDEADANCAYQLPVPTLYVATGAAALGLLAVSIAVTACIKLRRQYVVRGAVPGPGATGATSGVTAKSHAARHGGAVTEPPGTTVPHAPHAAHAAHLHHHHHHRTHNGGAADKRYRPAADDLYMDGKDSLC